ncbi:hypothetical protein BU24DRAFT_406700 [Aaosphaeria arxii CBS 175.79]|uniref:Uncharacterized protein n=1 Tax=Aaosphaeria arxii CBS 175.79 TaxID=1450172 RepID=A0A6A5Y4Z3_9PLEO|nr:uncharacterized protein BU24DRAFT_406700 [Aaosphaeria arxii CBS 175.79]KAF2020107.1 hypothetical protein BU24DRAFT_406700 [Aaosphaeria arxii CBS 175.79]
MVSAPVKMSHQHRSSPPTAEENRSTLNDLTSYNTRGRVEPNALDNLHTNQASEAGSTVPSPCRRHSLSALSDATLSPEPSPDIHQGAYVQNMAVADDLQSQGQPSMIDFAGYPEGVFAYPTNDLSFGQDLFNPLIHAQQGPMLPSIESSPYMVMPQVPVAQYSSVQHPCHQVYAALLQDIDNPFADYLRSIYITPSYIPRNVGVLGYFNSQLPRTVPAGNAWTSAVDHRYKVKQAPKPDGVLGLRDIIINAEVHYQDLYDAFISTDSDDEDTVETRETKKFRDHSYLKEKDEDIKATCRLILIALVDRVISGWRGNENPRAMKMDDDLNASDRLQEIITTLRKAKSACRDLLESDGKIQVLVHCPSTLGFRKALQLRGNKKKADDLKRLRGKATLSGAKAPISGAKPTNGVKPDVNVGNLDVDDGKPDVTGKNRLPRMSKRKAMDDEGGNEEQIQPAQKKTRRSANLHSVSSVGRPAKRKRTELDEDSADGPVRPAKGLRVDAGPHHHAPYTPESSTGDCLQARTTSPTPEYLWSYTQTSATPSQPPTGIYQPPIVGTALNDAVQGPNGIYSPRVTSEDDPSLLDQDGLEELPD